MRLGIALLIFIIPGALLYILLRQADKPGVKLLELIPIGFTFSTLMIGMIGLVGRFLGFSFVLVKFIFAFVGLIELFALAKIYPKIFCRNSGLYSGLRESLNNPPLLAALFFGVLFLINAALFFIDDWSYLAYFNELAIFYTSKFYGNNFWNNFN